ncbi:hypothetical protein SDJN03_03473, partial [Cucurbita argyrosperma subsp. sororia]
MLNFSHLFLFLAFFLVPSSVVSGTDHIVGDAQGWDLGVDYSSWTIGKTFFVGDNLVFKYKKGVHNVLDVNVTAFAECAAPTNQSPLKTGNDIIPLRRPGTRWFICSIARHCQSGQKLVIFVDNPPSNGGQASPPPSSLPLAPVSSPPPPSTSAPPPPSAPAPSQNQTTPHLPVPTPSESIPPSQSPVPSPSPTAPPPSGSASKAAISGHLGVLAVAVGALAGIMT